MDMGRAHPSVQTKSGDLESNWANQMEEPEKGQISEVHSQEKWGSVVGEEVERRGRKRKHS